MRAGPALAATLIAVCAASRLPGDTRQTTIGWTPVLAAKAAASPEQLAQFYPDSASVHLRLLNAQLDKGDKNGALTSLLWLKQHGHHFSKAGQAQVRQILSDWGYDAATYLATGAPPVSASTKLSVMPADALLVESVVRDLKSGRLFASTVVSRKLWFKSPGATWSPAELGALDSLSGLALDQRRGLLWIAAADLGMGPGATGAFRGLLAVDPISLKVQRQVAAPAGVNPSDIAVAQDGSVFASDPIGGGIYRLAPGGSRMDTFVSPGTFRSPQGLAESADGKLIYVSDYAYGLAAIDRESGRVWRMAASTELPIPLDGIDGLWRLGNTLVAVQNGTSPLRIVRLTLGPGRTTVSSAEVLERANPAWTEPVSGSLSGNALIYVATGQWDRFGDGKPKPDTPPLPTVLRILPLRTTKH